MLTLTLEHRLGPSPSSNALPTEVSCSLPESASGSSSMCPPRTFRSVSLLFEAFLLFVEQSRWTKMLNFSFGEKSSRRGGAIRYDQEKSSRCGGSDLVQTSLRSFASTYRSRTNEDAVEVGTPLCCAAFSENLIDQGSLERRCGLYLMLLPGEPWGHEKVMLAS